METEVAQNAPAPGDQQDEEISLIDLIAVLLQYKRLIIGVTALAMVAVVVASVISMRLPPEKSFMPNTYTSTALMLITESSGGGASSLLASSGLSSLASLAGVNVGGGTSNSSLAIYLTSTNSFLDAIVDEFGLIQKFKIEENVRAASRKMLSQKISASTDTDSGVLSLSVSDIDPQWAQDVAMYALEWLSARFDDLGLDNSKLQAENLEKNIDATYQDMLDLEDQLSSLGASIASGRAVPGGAGSLSTQITKIQLEAEAKKAIYTQLKAQYELLKVQMASESPVFQILEYPEVPDMKSGPSRGKLCIIVTFAAFFLSVFAAFAMNAYKNIRNDEEAWAKLHPARRQPRGGEGSGTNTTDAATREGAKDANGRS